MLKILSILLLLVGLEDVTCSHIPSTTIPTTTTTSPGSIILLECQPSFVAPTDGSVSCTDGNNYGSICTFTCDERTYMVGEPQSECQINETEVNWTSDAPLCVPLEGNSTCEPAFDLLADGSVNCTDGNFIGSVCTFACDEGYEMVGDDQSECLVAGFVVRYWTNRAPVCRPRTCQPAFVAPTDGYVSCTDGNNYGSVCTFTCYELTIMSGEPQSECQIDDTGVNWTSDAPLCVPLLGAPVCNPPFDAPSNGSVSCTHGNFFGSVCTFVCNEGFGMVGDGQSECIRAQHAMGDWTNKNAPRCVYLEPLLTCEPAFEAPTDGSVNCTDGNNIGSICTFTCDEGYKLEGDEQPSCAQGLETGVWTSSAPVCVAVDVDLDTISCQPAYEAPSYGSVSCTNGNNFGSVCIFTCDEGYKLIGEPQSTCNVLMGVTAQWSNFSPHYCVPENVDPAMLVCQPAFDAPTDGSVSCTSSNFYESVCTFTCDYQTHMVGEPQSECQFNEVLGFYWTNNAPLCNQVEGAVTCRPAFEAPEGGSINCTHDNFVGSVCTFDCDEGYYKEGSDESECIQVDEFSGNWTNNAPICQQREGAATCWPILEAPVGGSISCTDSNYGGSVCTFDCDEGYIIEGGDQSECVQFDEFRGNWTNNVPVCIPNYIIDKISCHPAFEAPVDGSVSCTNGNFIGSVCTFDCDEGYIMEGDDQSECVPDLLEITANWTNNAPTCIPDDVCLPALEAPAHGSVSCTDENSLGSVCTFACNDGYVMKGEPQSVCVTVLGAYTNWTSDAPVCLGNPCQNGGTFEDDGPFGFNCICPPQFKGPTCETPVGICELVRPCENGGVCEDQTPFGFVCNCAEGFSGKFCDTTLGCPSIDQTPLDTFNAGGLVPTTQAPTTTTTTTTVKPFVMPRITGPQRVTCTNQFNVGSVCTQQCQAGYTLIGDRTRECLMNGKWSGTDGRCKRTSCGQSTASQATQHCTNSDKPGSYCYIQCPPGMSTFGTTYKTCGMDYQWYPQTAWGCFKTSCDKPLPAITNGHIRCTDRNSAKSVCTATCNPGYILLGGSQITCSYRGLDLDWRGSSSFQCLKVPCEKSIDLRTGMTTGFDTSDYAAIIYQPYRSRMDSYDYRRGTSQCNMKSLIAIKKTSKAARVKVDFWYDYYPSQYHFDVADDVSQRSTYVPDRVVGVGNHLFTNVMMEVTNSSSVETRSNQVANYFTPLLHNTFYFGENFATFTNNKGLNGKIGPSTFLGDINDEKFTYIGLNRAVNNPYNVGSGVCLVCLNKD